MKGAKIQFSNAEMELLANAEIILTKNKALEKIKGLLEEVQKMQMDFVQANNLFHNGVFKVSSKISRGENYLGLPYLILDYPRNFTVDNILAIRTMFWWGNFFSSTLHISGEYLSARDYLQQQYQYLADRHYFVGINQDSGQHHFNSSNYKLIKDLQEKEFSAILYEMPQIKIAAKWPLTDWHLTATRFFESWRFLLKTSGLIS